MSVKTTKVHTTAVCFIPEEEHYEQIQPVRKMYDKAYERWMPHVNLLYPFLPEDDLSDAVLDRLAAAVGDIAPQIVTFDSISHFQHSARSMTFFFQPDEESIRIFRWIQGALVAQFPSFNELNVRSDDHLFHPHITLGQFSSNFSMQSAITDIKKTFRPFRCHFSHINVITRRGNTPFSVFRRIALGTGKTVLQAPVTTTVELDYIEEEKVRISRKLEDWISARRKSLPKTVHKLVHSIKPMCTSKVVVPTDTVLAALIDRDLLHCKSFADEAKVQYLPALTDHDEHAGSYGVDPFPEPQQHWVSEHSIEFYQDLFVARRVQENGHDALKSSSTRRSGRAHTPSSKPRSYASPFKLKFDAPVASKRRRAELDSARTVLSWDDEASSEPSPDRTSEEDGAESDQDTAAEECVEAPMVRTEINYPDGSQLEAYAIAKAARWLARTRAEHRPKTVKGLRNELLHVLTLKVQLDAGEFLRRVLEKKLLTIDTDGIVQRE